MPLFNIGMRVFGAFAGLLLLGWLIGWMLPRGYEASAEILIPAPPEQIFPFLNRLDEWPKWSQWREGKDSVFKVEYGADIEGEGAAQTWTEPRGSGKLWITRSQPNTRLEYQVDFAGFPRMHSEILLEPDSNGTRVRWNSRGRLPQGAFYGYLRIAFVNGLRQQYQSALEMLKQVVIPPEPTTPLPENGPAPPDPGS